MMKLIPSFFFNLLLFLSLFIGQAGARVSDTGQADCYDNTAVITCPSYDFQDFFGQDGQYLINPPSFTKLDQNGNELSDAASSWYMVRDNNTGLIWEAKTNNSEPDIHDINNFYSWEGAEGFIESLNSSGNFNDWRLPSVEELSTIFGGRRTVPGYFLTLNHWPFYSYHWTSSTYTGDTNKAWVVDAWWTFVGTYAKTDSLPVIAVRGGTPKISNRFIDNFNGTVTDRSTGLMWTKTPLDQDGDGTPDAMTWQDALAAVQSSHTSDAFGCYSDWRLPTIMELQTLTDFSISTIIIDSINLLDSTIFPNPKDKYWSSTTGAAADAAYVNFLQTDTNQFLIGGAVNKADNTMYAMAVRGGQSELPPPHIPGTPQVVTVNAPQQAETVHIGEQLDIEWEPDSAYTGSSFNIGLSRSGEFPDRYSLGEEMLATALPSSQRSFSWTVSGPETDEGVLTLSSVNSTSINPLMNSQGFFSIKKFHGAWVTPRFDAGQAHFAVCSLSLTGSNFKGDTWDIGNRYWTENSAYATIEGSSVIGTASEWVEVSTIYKAKTYAKNILLHTGSPSAPLENDTSPNTNGSMGDADLLADPLTSGLHVRQGQLPWIWVPPNPPFVGFYVPDSDYYRFVLDSPGIVDIGYMIKNTVQDADIQLLDGSGSVLASTPSRNGAAIFYPVGLEAGTYYISLRRTGSNSSDDSYIISAHRTGHSMVVQTPTPMVNGGAYTGVIQNKSETAKFTFSVESAPPGSAKITFTPSSSIGQYLLELVNDNDPNVIVDSVQCFGYVGVTLEGVYPAGDYTLRVTAGDGIDALSQFTVALSGSSQQLEVEENNSISEASLWNPDSPIQGRLGNDTDTDFYTFTLEAARYVDLVLSCPDSNRDFSLVLYKVTEEDVIGQLETLSGRDGVLSSGLLPGKYYLKVAGASGRPVDTVRPYSLSMTDSQSTQLEIEPNNTTGLATSLVSTTGVRKQGTIVSSADVDVFALKLLPGGSFYFRFTPESTFCGGTTADYKITIVDDNHTNLGTLYSNNGDNPDWSTPASPKPGIYYIIVESNGDVDPYTRYDINPEANPTNSYMQTVRYISSILITGEETEMSFQEVRNLQAFFSYSDASPLELLTSGVTWTSSQEDVATVNSNGQVTAGTVAGSTTIQATHSQSGHIRGKFSLVVGSPPEIVNNRGNAIIVAGRNGINDPAFLPIQYLTRLLYYRLGERTFNEEDIWYFNHNTSQPIDPVSQKEEVLNTIIDYRVDDETPTVAEIGEAITQWAVNPPQKTSGPLYLFLIDHGDSDAFMVSESIHMTADQLTGYINSFQSQTGRQVVILVDACKSGSFIDNLVTGSEDRVVITTARDDNKTYLTSSGENTFTDFFIAALVDNETIAGAFSQADGFLDTKATGFSRFITPQIKSGNGSTAEEIRLGGNGIGMSSFPQFSPVAATPLSGMTSNFTTSVTKGTTGATAISKVWGVVTSPLDYLPPPLNADPATQVMQQEQIVMQSGSVPDEYEGSYSNFKYNGVYKINFFALDMNGNIGQPDVATEIIVTNGIEPEIPGDMNADHDRTLADAIIALRVLSGLNTAGQLRTDYTSTVDVDINGNGRVDLAEVLFILREISRY